MKLNKIQPNPFTLRVRFSDLPGETNTTPSSTPPAAAAKPAKKSKKAATKKETKPAKTSAKKGKDKAPAKPAAKKPAVKKEPKVKTERKPRVEGRVDLIFRSGPERSIAIALAEKAKAGDMERVDNCTVGYKIKGEKAEALRATYIATRDEWRKRQDALLQKFLNGEITIKG